jgi:hypothetical protein
VPLRQVTRHVGVEQGTGTPDREQTERAHGHGPRGELGRRSLPGQLVGPSAAHLDGADAWRDLLDLAGQLVQEVPALRRRGRILPGQPAVQG